MPAGALRVGTAEEMAGAVTRSHLADGRCVGWFGDPDVVIDAELADQTVPPALAARYGTHDFWRRWTAAECRAKRADVPIATWLRRHGLGGGGSRVDVRTCHLQDVVVSVLGGVVTLADERVDAGRS